MIFECDCKIIVQLCNWIENDKEKCCDYTNINKINYRYEIKEINFRWRDSNVKIKELKVRNKKTKVEKNVFHMSNMLREFRRKKRYNSKNIKMW